VRVTTSKAWPVKRLKYAVVLRRDRVEGLDQNRPYVGLEHIESGTGRLLSPKGTGARIEETPATPSESLCNTFEPGDVLFGKLRPYLAKAWVAEFSGRCTTELLVMQPVDFEPRFLRYICISRSFIDAVDASTFGSKMPRADWDFIGNMPVPLPLVSQQRTIADFLDRRAAKLDALVEAKQRLLGLLADKRQEITTRAVTCGLNPDARFRDSGISWLAQIPAHWETRRIAWLFRDRDERCEPELPLLEVSINSGVVMREFSNDRIESTAEDFNTYKVARKGDVVFNKMRMWQGAVGIAPEDGLVSPDYTVAAPVGTLSPEYAELLFRTEMFSAECARHSHGIVWDRLRLYWEGFRDIVVPLPPLPEQRAIVAYISTETAKLEGLREAAERAIGLLKERRSALISAGVTGQIEVN